jgi:hypothetical protein
MEKNDSIRKKAIEIMTFIGEHLIEADNAGIQPVIYPDMLFEDGRTLRDVIYDFLEDLDNFNLAKH